MELELSVCQLNTREENDQITRLHAVDRGLSEKLTERGRTAEGKCTEGPAKLLKGTFIISEQRE